MPGTSTWPLSASPAFSAAASATTSCRIAPFSITFTSYFRPSLNASTATQTSAPPRAIRSVVCRTSLASTSPPILRAAAS